MNLDFTKPREKAKEMALEMGIDLTDPVVIREFQKIQTERLKELKAVKEGKKKQLQPPEFTKEDYNDVFRESNRALIDDIPKIDKSSIKEDKKEDCKEEVKEEDEVQVQPNIHTEQIPQKRLDEYEDDHVFNPKIVII